MKQQSTSTNQLNANSLTWIQIDAKHVPCFLKNGEGYIPVRFVEQLFLSGYPDVVLDDVTPLVAVPLKDEEANVLNSLLKNKGFCHGYGDSELNSKYTTDDFLVSLKEFINFYKETKRRFDFSKGGWLQVKNTVVPYVNRSDTMIIPLDIIRYGANLLKELDCTQFEIQASQDELNFLNKILKKEGFYYNLNKNSRLIDIAKLSCLCDKAPLIHILPPNDPMNHVKYDDSETSEESHPCLETKIKTEKTSEVLILSEANEQVEVGLIQTDYGVINLPHRNNIQQHPSVQSPENAQLQSTSMSDSLKDKTRNNDNINSETSVQAQNCKNRLERETSTSSCFKPSGEPSTAFYSLYNNWTQKQNHIQNSSVQSHENVQLNAPSVSISPKGMKRTTISSSKHTLSPPKKLPRLVQNSSADTSCDEGGNLPVLSSLLDEDDIFNFSDSPVNQSGKNVIKHSITMDQGRTNAENQKHKLENFMLQGRVDDKKHGRVSTSLPYKSIIPESVPCYNMCTSQNHSLVSQSQKNEIASISHPGSHYNMISAQHNISVIPRNMFSSTSNGMVPASNHAVPRHDMILDNSSHNSLHRNMYIAGPVPRQNMVPSSLHNVGMHANHSSPCNYMVAMNHASPYNIGVPIRPSPPYINRVPDHPSLLYNSRVPAKPSSQYNTRVPTSYSSRLPELLHSPPYNNRVPLHPDPILNSTIPVYPELPRTTRVQSESSFNSRIHEILHSPPCNSKGPLHPDPILNSKIPVHTGTVCNTISAIPDTLFNNLAFEKSVAQQQQQQQQQQQHPQRSEYLNSHVCKSNTMSTKHYSNSSEKSLSGCGFVKDNQKFDYFNMAWPWKIISANLSDVTGCIMSVTFLGKKLCCLFKESTLYAPLDFLYKNYSSGSSMESWLYMLDVNFCLPTIVLTEAEMKAFVRCGLVSAMGFSCQRATSIEEFYKLLRAHGWLG